MSTDSDRLKYHASVVYLHPLGKYIVVRAVIRCLVPLLLWFGIGLRLVARVIERCAGWLSSVLWSNHTFMYMKSSYGKDTHWYLRTGVAMEEAVWGISSEPLYVNATPPSPPLHITQPEGNFHDESATQSSQVVQGDAPGPEEDGVPTADGPA